MANLTFGTQVAYLPASNTAIDELRVTRPIQPVINRELARNWTRNLGALVGRLRHRYTNYEAVLNAVPRCDRRGRYDLVHCQVQAAVNDALYTAIANTIGVHVDQLVAQVEQVTALTQQVDSLTQQVNNLNEDNAALTQQVNDLDSRNEEMLDALSAAEDRADELQARLDAIEASRTTMRNSFNDGGDDWEVELLEFLS